MDSDLYGLAVFHVLVHLNSEKICTNAIIVVLKRVTVQTTNVNIQISVNRRRKKKKLEVDLKNKSQRNSEKYKIQTNCLPRDRARKKESDATKSNGEMKSNRSDWEQFKNSPIT